MTARLLVPLAIAALLVSACGASVPSPAQPAVASPPGSAAPAARTTAGAATPTPTLGVEWLPAAIANPADVVSWASQPPGYFCDPCHNLAEDDLFGVGATPSGLIAVGAAQPPARAVAFVSGDGRAWTALPDFAGGPGSAAVAVASAQGRTVIVGHDATGAAAWSSGGIGWTAAPRQASLMVPYAAGGMTSVIPFAGGFVAGGYRDDPSHAASAAAVWRSEDGLAWSADPADVFAGGRIWGLAASGSTIVAVGTAGDVNYGPAAAWRWTAATGWRIADLGSDSGGAMRAVVATAGGFVAVGLDGHDDGARVWTSSDGLAWRPVPDQNAFRFYGLPVRMQGVALGPAGLVAGGWRSDAGKGS